MELHLSCARCILERTWAEKNEPEIASQPEFAVMPAEVIYRGTSLCQKHLIGAVARRDR